MKCIVEGCNRPMAPSPPTGKWKGVLRKYCWGHLKRKQKGLRVDVPLRHWGKPGVGLRKAATAYADATTDEEQQRTAARLRMAAKRASSGQ